MKEKTINYFKQYGLSLAIFFIIFTALPILCTILFFSFAPIGMIADTHSAFAEDVYLSEGLMQKITFNRTIHHTHEAEIIRELNLVNVNREVIYKTSFSTIDERDSGVMIVHYELPEGLQEGEYFWSIGITRHFNYGVTRYVESETNVFKVNN